MEEKLNAYSVQFSHSVVSVSLQPYELLHARPPCPSPTARIYWNPCPSSQWCHPAILSSVVPFSSCPQSLPASGSFPMSQLFSWGGQSTGVSASASVLPMNTQDCLSLCDQKLVWKSYTVCDSNKLKFWKRQNYGSSAECARWFSLVQPLATPENPMDGTHQTPLSMGLSRQECWSRQPFSSSGDLPNPGIEPRSLVLQVDSLPSELLGMDTAKYESNTCPGLRQRERGIDRTQMTFMAMKLFCTIL